MTNEFSFCADNGKLKKHKHMTASRPNKTE